MPLQKQLSDLRADHSIRGVSQNCNSSSEYLGVANTVIRQLMKRGSWYGLEVLTKLCIYGCSVVFPRHVGTVIGAKTCNGEMSIRNNWFEIVGGSSCCSNFQPNSTLMDDGQSPIYREVSGPEGKQISYHVVKNADIGKTVKIYGFFYGGQPIQEKVNGVWEDGITIVATMAGGATLPAMTPADKLITKITHVVRQPTSGMTYLYEYGPDADGTNALVDIGAYEPNETNPMYRKMRIKGYSQIPGSEDDYGRTKKVIECMVKLEFIDLVNDYDFLLIDDFDALRYGIQAYNNDMAGAVEQAEAFWAKAIRELNFNDRNKTPGQQINVKVRALGSNRVITNPI